MTCLNNNVCRNKPKYYYEWCNFNSVDGYYYEAAPNITCTRDNIADLYPNCTNCWTGFIDCCADNIEECCIRSQTSFPTSTPTSSPTPLCNENHYFQELLFHQLLLVSQNGYLRWPCRVQEHAL